MGADMRAGEGGEQEGVERWEAGRALRRRGVDGIKMEGHRDVCLSALKRWKRR